MPVDFIIFLCDFAKCDLIIMYIVLMLLSHGDNKEITFEKNGREIYEILSDSDDNIQNSIPIFFGFGHSGQL